MKKKIDSETLRLMPYKDYLQTENWKLRNYYNATVRNKKLEIQPIHLFGDKDDDLPF